MPSDTLLREIVSDSIYKAIEISSLLGWIGYCNKNIWNSMNLYNMVVIYQAILK